MSGVRISLRPGDTLIIECESSDTFAGPDGTPDDEVGGPEPTAGITLGEFSAIVAEHGGIPPELVSPSNPEWPRDETGAPIPGDYVWGVSDGVWSWQPPA